MNPSEEEVNRGKKLEAAKKQARSQLGRRWSPRREKRLVTKLLGR